MGWPIQQFSKIGVWGLYLGKGGFLSYFRNFFYLKTKFQERGFLHPALTDRRTDYTMAIRKMTNRQATAQKTLHRKFQIEQHYTKKPTEGEFGQHYTKQLTEGELGCSGIESIFYFTSCTCVLLLK
jgi:hypothetical protein